MPGNHDWYDGLHGFMSHLCGIDVAAGAAEGRPGRARAAGAPAVAADGPARATRTSPRCARTASRPTQFCDPPQPGPYWAIDAGPVRIVGIDTGIVGALDAEQAAWLRRVSLGSDRPKILITGKPLIVNGELDPGGAAASTSRDVVATRRPTTWW